MLIESYKFVTNILHFMINRLTMIDINIYYGGPPSNANSIVTNI